MNQRIRKTALLMSALALMGLCYSPQANAAVNAIDGIQQSSKKVTGTVSDAEGPVIGATVTEKGNPSNGVYQREARCYAGYYVHRLHDTGNSCG